MNIIYGTETLMKVQIARIKSSYKRRESAIMHWDACADCNTLRHYLARPVAWLIVLFHVWLIESGNRAPRPQYFHSHAKLFEHDLKRNPFHVRQSL